MFRRFISSMLIIGLMLSISSLSYAEIDTEGHGYHYIRATSSKYVKAYGHVQLPQYYAVNTPMQTHPEVFFGMYYGPGLDMGLVARSDGWHPFFGGNPGILYNCPDNWYEGSVISNLGPSDYVYLEVTIKKVGSDYYVEMYCKENGSYSNKTKVLEHKVSSSWGANVYNYGAIINREIAVASNDTEFLNSGAYLYNAKWIDGGLVTKSGYTYTWTDSRTGYKMMVNDDGAASGYYYDATTGTSEGYATEEIDIDYRGGL